MTPEKPKRKNGALSLREQVSDMLLRAKYFEYETVLSIADCAVLLEQMGEGKWYRRSDYKVMCYQNADGLEFEIIYTARGKKSVSDQVMAVGRIYTDYGQNVTHVVGKAKISGSIYLHIIALFIALYFFNLLGVSSYFLTVGMGFIFLLMLLNYFTLGYRVTRLRNYLFERFRLERQPHIHVPVKRKHHEDQLD